LNTKNEEYNNLLSKNGNLDSQITELRELLAAKENEIDSLRASFSQEWAAKNESQQLEFDKLVAENSNLIHEIDAAQDKVEALEAELNLIKTELTETTTTFTGKVEDLKETLNNKNFEITNISANNSALTAEVSKLKEEIGSLSIQLSESSNSSELTVGLQESLENLSSEKNSLLDEINLLKTTITELNESTAELNSKVTSYEKQLSSLQSKENTPEQDAFIDKLFKQIDVLNDERLQLLTDKEEMAAQLLKMNDVISGISQNIDSQSIDVTDLNNHRKNIILGAKSSEGSNERAQMKKQINELVREIDKCIALLSA
jgi:chromosome segregation ATPase